MIQDFEDNDWMLRDAHAHTFRALAGQGLSFDALIQPRHLSAIRKLLARHPDLRVAINHCGKPEVRLWQPGDADFQDWATHMTAIARETSAYCKLSALPTRAGPHWTAETFAPYVDVLWQTFGPKRLMWASDWAILERGGSYDNWRATALELLARYPGSAPVLGPTAQEFYRI